MNSTAIHEAGHAVIGRVLGMTCGGATIIANEAEGEAGHNMIADPHRIQCDWENRGKYRDLRSVFMGRIFAYMAGAEAERELLGRKAEGDGDDQAQIAMMAESGLDLTDSQWEKYEPRMWHQTRRLVRKNRSKIERVAGALEERGTLQAEEIDLLLANEAEARATMPTSDRALKQKLRKQGLGLKKSRSRTPENPEFGRYHIYDIDRNFAVAGVSPWQFSLSLAEVEQWLND